MYLSARIAGEHKYCNSLGVFNKTIIPLALVGYEIDIANSALRASLAMDHFISNARSWNNCKIYVHSEKGSPFGWNLSLWPTIGSVPGVNLVVQHRNRMNQHPTYRG